MPSTRQRRKRLDLTQSGPKCPGVCGVVRSWRRLEVELADDPGDGSRWITRASLSTTVPIVAALNGIAVGCAAELTLRFDARIVPPSVEYFFPENHLG
jgi:enoyl-CoA hydratase/carnithine racemase